MTESFRDAEGGTEDVSYRAVRTYEADGEMMSEPGLWNIGRESLTCARDVYRRECNELTGIL